MHRILSLLLLAFLTMPVGAITVRFETSLGNIDILMLEDEAPISVANFLEYVNSGRYDGVIFHRTELNGIQIIQGGGFIHQNDGVFQTVAPDSPITLEFGVPNTRGTMAMARTNEPDSATNQWFFNAANNSQALDATSNRSGYAVFGQVVEGMEIVELISTLRTLDLRQSSLGAAGLFVPSFMYTGEVFSGNGVTNFVQSVSALDDSHFITVERAYELGEAEFKVNAGISGAWFNPATNGQGFYFEMLPDSDALLAAWFTYDLTQPDEAVTSSIGHPGHRWLTSQGAFEGNVFTQPIALTSNGIFDSGDAVQTVAAGTLSIEFTSCFEAVVTYQIDEGDLTGTFPITRLSGDNVAMCETLSAVAQ